MMAFQIAALVFCAVCAMLNIIMVLMIVANVSRR